MYPYFLFCMASYLSLKYGGPVEISKGRNEKLRKILITEILFCAI